MTIPEYREGAMFPLCSDHAKPTYVMARLARIVVPGLPHHVTARGNRREPIFFEDGDQDIYCDLLAERCARRRWRSGPIA
jgi:hypothetical protein